MSKVLLSRVRNHVNASSLNAGYTTKFYRWSDKDIAGKKPFIVYRQSSGAGSNILLQQTDVLIQLCQNPSGIVTGDTRIQAIMRLFRGETVQAGIVRFDPVGTVTGPFYLENGRPLWELIVRCMTEDQ